MANVTVSIPAGGIGVNGAPRVFATYSGGAVECLQCGLFVWITSPAVWCPRCGWSATIVERRIL